MIESDWPRIEASLNKQLGIKEGEDLGPKTAQVIMGGFMPREISTVVPYLEWIVKYNDSRLYFMQGSTLKIQFILEFGKRV